MADFLTDRQIYNFWTRHPNLRGVIKFLLFRSADINISTGKFIGRVYTILFGRLGVFWFDHRFDHLRGINNFHWLERAFYTLERVKKGSNLLDVGFGDGVYDGVFYSQFAETIVAIDKDKRAVNHAKKYYNRENVLFFQKDVTRWNPKQNSFNIVTMFAVIEHFTKNDGIKIMRKLKASLTENGILLGSTPIFTGKNGAITNEEHKNEFLSEDALRSFLRKVFRKVIIKKSIWDDERTDYYFECYK